MSRPQLIQITLESMADWDVDIADIIEPYINKLEQENKELKAALLKFIQLDSHDPDLKDDLWCLQQEESPLINPDSVCKQIAEHDADVIELFIEGVNDKYGYHTGVNTNWVVNVEDMKECIKQLHQKAQVTK